MTNEMDQLERKRQWRANYRERERERLANDPKFAERLRLQKLAYLDRHKARLNAERRDRMSDPAERKRFYQFHSDWRERVRDGHTPELVPLYLVPKNRKRKQRVFRESEVLRMLGIPRITMIRWRNDGWVPDASTQHRNRRVFTRRQIDLLAHFYEQPCHDHEARSKASRFLFLRWDK